MDKQISTDDGMVLLETALPATDTMETISLVVREQDSARCPDSRIRKIDEIPQDLHGEWLVVQHCSKMKLKKDPQIKGKNLEQNLGKNVLVNRFDSLIVEENKEKDTQV